MQRILCLIVWLSLASVLHADDLPVVIVAGQSNAFRLGSLSQAKHGSPKGTTIYYYANPQCTDAHDLKANMQMLNADQPIGGMGAGIAQALRKRHPKGFAIVRYAICGSDLHTQWKPTKKDGFYRRGFVPFVKQSLAAIAKTSGRKPKLVGMLWHQGESNSQSEEAVAAHARLLPALITNFREDFGAVPIAMGEVRELASRPGTKQINATLHRVARETPGVGVADLNDVAWLPKGNVHLSKAGAIEAGRRLVAACGLIPMAPRKP